VIVPEAESFPWSGNQQGVLREIAFFLEGVRNEEATLRILKTVMFTDIVGSTEKLVEIGDRAWTVMVERQHESSACIARTLSRNRG
jgi:class 3 adenylate cyclase